jgi:2-iminobutanoate/2-iminopropanoate deaminase
MPLEPAQHVTNMATPLVQRVDAPGVTAPPNATWSNCLVIGREVAMSGVTARGSDGRPAGGASMKGQTLACLQRIDALMQAAGGNLGNVYKLVIYVTDITRKDEVNAARAEALAPVYPCSTLVEVKGFAFPDLLVEIDAFANLDANLGKYTHQASS